MATKKLSPENQAAQQALTQRLLITLRFMEDVQKFPSGAQFRNLVESLAADGDLRGLRMIARDIDEVALALAPHEREGLEAILRQRLGVDKEPERAEMSRRAALAIKRGTVASEKERRHLERYVEMLEAIGGDRAELEAVEDLLTNG